MPQRALGAPNLSKSFVSLLESGRSFPSVETVVTLAARVNSSIGALLLDGPALRREAALTLIHLAGQMDLAAHGAAALQLITSAEVLLTDTPLEVRIAAALLRARVAIAQNDLELAAQWAEAAVREARQHQRPNLLGMALAVRGLVELRRGAHKAAQPLLEEAVATLDGAKAMQTEEAVRALLSLGATQFRLGQITRARRAYRRASDLSMRLGLHMLRGRALTGLGLVAWKRRQLDEAARLFSDARDELVQVEDIPEISRVLSNLGLVLREQGRPDDALRVLRQALQIRERLPAPRERSATLDEMAQVYVALGRPTDAVRAARRAIKEARDGADPTREAVAHVTLGRALRAHGRHHDAVNALRDAVAMFTRLGLEDRAAMVAGELGLLLRDTGAHAEAASYLARALQASTSKPPALPTELLAEGSPV